MTIGEIRKAIVAVLAALATWGITASADESYTAAEWWGLLGVAVAAIAVYAIPNDRPKEEVVPIDGDGVG